MSTKRLDLAEWAIKTAQKKGASEVAVNISNQRQVEIEFRDKKLETFTSTANIHPTRQMIFAKTRWTVLLMRLWQAQNISPRMNIAHCPIPSIMIPHSTWI